MYGASALSSIALGAILNILIFLGGLALAGAAFKLHKSGSGAKAMIYGLGAMALAQLAHPIVWLIYTILSYVLLQVGSYDLLSVFGILNSLVGIGIVVVFLAGSAGVFMGVGADNR